MRKVVFNYFPICRYALILIDSSDPCAARLLTFEDNFFTSLAVTRQDDTHIHL